VVGDLLPMAAFSDAAAANVMFCIETTIDNGKRLWPEG